MKLAPGSRVLDLGAGPGWFWARAAGTERSQELVVSDLSRGMVREARRNLFHAAARVRFLVCDVQALPFEAGRFDVVLANHMLYHVPDRERALREIARALRPGGRLYASTVGASHMREIDELARAVVPDQAWMRFVSSGFTLDTGREELARVFQEVELDRYPDELRVNEAEALLDYLRSMASAPRLDPPALARLRDAILGRIARDGAFRVTKDTGLFTARRLV